MFFILEGFGSQYHHVILPQDEIAAGDEDTVVALYNGNDDTLGQMQLGDALVHPGIPGCEVDPDKVYVGLLSVFRHALDAGILVYKTCGYDTGWYVNTSGCASCSRLYMHRLDASIRMRIVNTEEKSCCLLLFSTSVINFSES